MWYIDNIKKLFFPEKHLLPRANFVLANEEETIHVTGWLPCHHTNIAYNLDIKNNRILRVIDMSVDKTKKQKTKIITQTARKIKSQKAFAKGVVSEVYKTIAMEAYTSTALWTCVVLYSHYEIRHMDIRKTFIELARDIECIIQPDSKASRTRFLYQPITKTKILVQRALTQMGELPYEDWTGFCERRKWHIRMQSDTGCRKKPSSHIRRLEHYQNIWTTTHLIEEARQLQDAFCLDNITLIEGSPCPDNLPKDVSVVFRSLEDAYKWKCVAPIGTLYIMSNLDCYANPDRLIELGLAEIQPLAKQQTLYMPWAHTWGQQDWLDLANYEPEHITCIGRLDQWPRGRGQLFRDMIMSKKFDTSKGYHAAADNVVMVQVQDIPKFVKEIQEEFKVIQCFCDETREDIDCGRRWLTKPKRIRTIRPSQETEQLLFEERQIHFPDRVMGNASVVKVRSYTGLKVPAIIYICQEETTPFDIHVARTHCTDILYVVNCSKCLFSMQKQAPAKCTINPFI